MRDALSAAARFVLALLICLSCARLSLAYTYHQVGVGSNFLVDDGRVYFAQADGSLTALDLDTGEVLRRKKDGYYSGALMRVDEGILVLTYGKITLLAPRTLSRVWETTSHYEANVTEGLLVSYDGCGLVQCRALGDGSVRWSYNLPGALTIVAEAGKVLVHKKAVFEGTPATVLLDLNTGRELYRKETPSQVRYVAAFLDGTHVFLATASSSGGPYDAIPDRMTIWDSSGKEVNLLPLPASAASAIREEMPLVFEDKIFYRGRVYPAEKRLPPEVLWRSKGPTTEYDGVQTTVSEEFAIEDGVVLVERRYLRTGPAGDVTITLNTPRAKWRGRLPYLTGIGEVSVIGTAKNRLLIGSNIGHVECVDESVGKSLWIYVFPTMRHTVTFSARGMAPTMAEAAAIYRRENARRPLASGLTLVDAGEQASKPRVIFDPEPTDPFSRLPLYLSIAWGGAGLPLALMASLLACRRTRRSDARLLALVSAVLAGASTGCFMFYGRVSVASSVALRFTIVAGIAVGLFECARAFGARKRILATLLGLALLVLLVFILALVPW